MMGDDMMGTDGGWVRGYRTNIHTFFSLYRNTSPTYTYQLPRDRNKLKHGTGQYV
jgi:hypothetical protein